jgi:predicted amidohydrolase YtcJ
MTLDAAHASFSEATIGNLKKGKKADFVVLDRDIMRPEVVLANETWKAQVVATVVDGKVMYGRI